MGFLNSCWEAFLQVASYGHLLDGNFANQQQQPLDISTHHASQHDIVASSGVSFEVAGTNFTCNYPTMTGYRACNTPNDRSCWLGGLHSRSDVYDIHTPYDMPGDEYAPAGIEREYWLEVSVHPIAPDGYLKPLGLVFNHTYPGPSLEACWGDTMVVHVTNKIPNLGTTIHWHGIRQLNTTQQDGVNGVTQCPIAYNETYTYRFRADQYGHTWYHSHYQTQYSDGIAGPLTIYGPSSADWDETFDPIMMQDWVHANTSIAFQQELARGIPVADSLLLGGKSSFKCSNLDPSCCTSCRNTTCINDPTVDKKFCCNLDSGCYTDPNNASSAIKVGSTYTQNFTKGKRYLLKLINASAESMFLFSIDGHDLLVIEADLVPIKPYMTKDIFVAIGQRYQVVVTAKPNRKSVDGNYWIRTRIASQCGTVAQDEEEIGIIRYNATSTATPTTLANTDREACQDEPVESLRPIVPWNVTTLKNHRQPFTFDASFDNVSSHGAFRWELKDKPLFLDYAKPSILHLDDTAHLRDEYQAVVNYTNHAWNNGFVYLVITGNNTLNIPGKSNVPAAHPIHLHGHDFVILSQMDKTWDGTIPPNQLMNPTRRDTALLYAGGYLALAFKLDNPGVWLVHCHIAWHASSGLALQIIERQDEIIRSIGSLDATRDTCAGWDKMDLRFEQEDSGI